jgi:predicted Zn-dependent peptidase
MSSRLFQEVREKRGLAYSVYSYSSSYADTGLFGIYAGCQPKRVEEVLAICREELQRVSDQGITEEELKRAIGQISGSTVLGMEDTGSLMSRIGKAELCYGTHLSVDELLAKISGVTLDDVREVASSVLGAYKPSLAVIGPVSGKRAERLTEAVS